jgi:hypothetical protein
MNYRIPVLVLLVCLAAVPALTADSNYMGGNVVLGGAGPRQITQVTPVSTETTTAPVPVQALAPSGSLSVTTSPAGAAVLVDGVQRGISPATIPGLLAGNHTVLLKREGYQDFSAPVTITAGQTQTLTTTLSPAAGTAAVPAPVPTKTPGFGMTAGLAALGAVLLMGKTIR